MTTETASEPFVFTPATTAPAVGPKGASRTDRLVSETRREIAEIVREVAVAVRSDRTTDEFFGLLVDRMARAMAPEGVVVWRLDDSIRCQRRLGKITDQSIPSPSIATHQRLLAEVANEGQPVVVPASPGAIDAEVPANPTDVPVALVPIELEPSAEGPSYLVEVFLEPGCGVATQRGYLRFVAQMADLAGEFLRGEQLRRLRRSEQRSNLVDDAIIDLHRHDDRNRLAADIVDQAAEIFGFDRVGLCTGEDSQLIAVSHVESIDHQAEAARQMTLAASQHPSSAGDHSGDAVPAKAEICTWYEDPQGTDHELRLRAVVADRARSSLSLVCLQVADMQPIPEDSRDELVRFMQHADVAWNHLSGLITIPGGRLLDSLLREQRTAGTGRLRKWMVVSALATVMMLAACFPVPLVVSSPATIRPQQVQRITAPRDAVVDQIHIEHGQAVVTGDLLMTLTDSDLEEQVATLIGRRAVLVQQKSHWTGALVDTDSHQLDRMEQVQGESRLVDEEIQSIDDQLAVLSQAEASLEIRANRNGIVDAWQIEQRLQSRPLQRGDPLMQVIATDTAWTAEATVAQTRVAHLHQAIENETIGVNVSIDSDPATTYLAAVERVGPALNGEPGATRTTAVLIALNDRAASTLSAKQQHSHQSGAPARVMFHCGSAPAAYVLFQDLIRSVRTNAALYFGGQEDHT